MSVESPYNSSNCSSASSSPPRVVGFDTELNILSSYENLSEEKPIELKNPEEKASKHKSLPTRISSTLSGHYMPKVLEKLNFSLRNKGKPSTKPSATAEDELPAVHSREESGQASVSFPGSKTSSDAIPILVAGGEESIDAKTDSVLEDLPDLSICYEDARDKPSVACLESPMKTKLKISPAPIRKSRPRNSSRTTHNHSDVEVGRLLTVTPVFKSKQKKPSSGPPDLEKAVRHIREVLAQKFFSIRLAFRELDPRSYGYIDTDHFRKALDDPKLGLELSDEEKDMVIALADKDNSNKIRYHHFFQTFFSEWFCSKRNSVSSQMYPVNILPFAERSTLKHVVVVARHGSRFPLGRFKFNSSWPRNKKFWELYGGKLSHQGHEDHIALGSMLREKYIEREFLVSEDDPNFPQKVYCFTSNRDRTISSAQSLLLALFPNVPQSFAVENEIEDAHIRRDYQGIVIHIADMSQDWTPLLHGYKNNERLKVLQKEEFEATDYFRNLAKDQIYVNLLEKLWRMTGSTKLNPSKNTLLQRLQHLQVVVAQIEVERSLKMHVLSNCNGLTLEEQDEELCKEVGAQICHLRYQGTSHAKQREMSRLAAGTLPFHIVDIFRRVASGKSSRKLSIYAAHDNTVMALLSHLGFRDWPVPQFASCVIFELHRGDDGGFFVKIGYIDDPKHCHLNDIFYCRMPPKHKIHNWNSAEEGYHSLEDFVDNILIHRRSFQSEEEWREAAKHENNELFPFEEGH